MVERRVGPSRAWSASAPQAVGVGLLVVEYIVVPQLAGAREALSVLGDVDWWLLIAGVALEAASLAAYSQVLRILLSGENPPSLGTTLRIQLATRAMSHVVPGGAAAGTGLGYDLLTRVGISGGRAGFALGAQGLGSAVVVNVILSLALVASIPARGFHPLYATAALVGVLLLAVLGGTVAALTRGEERSSRWFGALARRLPLVREDTVRRVLTDVAARLRELGGDRRALVLTAGWAGAAWLLDAASLWVFLAAFGHVAAPDALLVTYGIANVLAALPLTPGGLGIVEGVSVPLLVGFGAPAGQALLGVVAWRLVNFWLPIPIGAASDLSLRIGVVKDRASTLDELEHVAARAGAKGRLHPARVLPRDRRSRHGHDGRDPDQPPSAW